MLLTKCSCLIIMGQGLIDSEGSKLIEQELRKEEVRKKKDRSEVDEGLTCGIASVGMVLETFLQSLIQVTIFFLEMEHIIVYGKKEI